MSAIGTIAGTLSGIAGGDPLGGLISGAAGSAAGFVLHGISAWVLNGTRDALEQVARAIGAATAPNLDSTWFSSTYWRVAALAAMLTLPFLCAAAVQAVARADLALLARAAFGYLPLSVVGVSLAAPLTMLLLAASDQMSAVVSASAATGGARFLDRAAQVAGTIALSSGGSGGSAFFPVIVGLLAVMAALALAVELLVRAAAVYVVVLMLPLAFAALVWPARRVWAARLVELLVSLILSKFVIVAVLSLASAAFAANTTGVGELLVAMSLLLLSTFAPWALMRILPFTELAAGAAGILRGELGHAHERARAAAERAAPAAEAAMEIPARLRDQARAMHAAGAGDDAFAAAEAAGGQPLDSPIAAARAAHDHSGQSADGSAPDDLYASAVALAEPPPAGGPGPRPGSAPADDQPGFILPEAWRGNDPVRLDERLLRPPARPAGGPQDQRTDRPQDQPADRSQDQPEEPGDA